MAEVVNVLKFKTGHGLARTGDQVVVVIKKARPISSSISAQQSSVQKVKRGDVRRAVIVRTKKEARRPDGRFVRFDTNAGVLLNNKGDPLGTRITGVVSASLRQVSFFSYLSFA